MLKNHFLYYVLFFASQGLNAYGTSDRNMSSSDYGTHIAPLITAVLATDGPVLELGCGDFSTPLLHAICAKQNRLLISTDTDKAWLELFKDLNSSLHQFIYVPVYKNDWDVEPKPYLWDAIGNDYQWGVVFVDHRSGERRKIDVERFKNAAQIIVVHDTQQPTYEFEPILETFKYRYDYKRYSVYTTLVSNFIDVRKLFEN